MIIIPIEREEVPARFEIDIAGEDFEMEIRHNGRFDFYTVDLHKDGQLIVAGEKIVYGRALFSTLPDDSVLPKYPITPISEAGEPASIGYENFGTSVFLTIGDPNE